MKRMFMFALVAVMLFGLVGCAQGEMVRLTGEIVRADKQRVTSPDVSEADLVTLVDGNNAFTFDLYEAIKEGDGNIFYSPYSISLALAMAYAGARGETEQQMADTLCFTLSQDRLHPAFNSLDIELASRGEGAKGKDEEGFRLNLGPGELRVPLRVP